MSVEKLASRALWRLFFFRFLGDLVAFPRMIFFTITQFFASIEKTVFTLECDAARRYRAITNTDLALAVGEPSRYSGLRAGVADLRDRAYDAANPATGDDEE